MKSNRTILQLFMILFTLFFIVACECVYDYRFSVKNRTQEEVKIYLYGGFMEKTSDTIIINPGDSVFIFSDDDYWPGGCPGPEKEDFYFVIDSINLKMNDTIPSITDFMELSHWHYYPIDKGWLDYRGANFVLIVNDEDFE